MTVDNQSFWPEKLTESNITLPSTMLSEAASQLRDQTNGLILGSVQSGRDSEGDITHTLFKEVPALDGYKYQLFYMWHTLGAYPVRAAYLPANNAGTVEIADEEGLRDYLKKCLSSPGTRKIIETLMAQARAAASS